MQKANEIRVEKVDGLQLVKEFAATLEREVASKNTVLLVSIQGRRESSEAPGQKREMRPLQAIHAGKLQDIDVYCGNYYWFT